MTVGTIFTLFVVPVFYSLLAAKHQASPVEEEEVESREEPVRRGQLAVEIA